MRENPFSQIEGLDFTELADLISERVHNPITIEDFNHRLIAYSTHGNWTDQARMETIMGRRVPETVLNRLWQDGVIQELMGCDDPIRIQAKNEVGLGDRVAISIRKGQSVLGYIWVQEVNRHLSEYEMQLLRLAAKAMIPKLHQRQTKRRIQQEKSKEFFWEMLLGQISSHQEIQTKAEDIGIKLPRPFSVFLFQTHLSDYPSVQKELNYLLHNLKDSFPLTQFPLVVTDQRRLVVLGGGGDTRIDFHDRSLSFVRDIVQRLQDRFGELPVSGVYGMPYSSFSYVKQSYHQALAVLRAKNNLPQETKDILGYVDLGIYRLLPMLGEKNEAESYVNYRLEKLKRYDLDNQSHLLQTLEVYLDCAGRVNAASQHLHIHPNTLAYRLKRISEVAGLNLDDPNQRFAMFIDLKLMKLSQ